MNRQVPVHYLRPNETEWTPRCVIALDSETYTIEEDRDVLALRCWCASRIDRIGGISDEQSVSHAQGQTARALAQTIDEWTVARPSIWLYAHNLGFDLTVTRLPIELASFGWTVTDFALDGRAPWVRLANGRRRITMADSWSWIAKPLERIASAVGITKPPLPEDVDSLELWFARCRADVDILMAAITQLMDWWQTSGRGRWSVTGAASGWNTFRHIKTPFRMVIDPDPAGMAHDRTAIYGGKRYVNRVGNLAAGRYVEADFARAYTTVARDLPVPIQRMRPFARLDNDDVRISSDRWGIIGQVVLETTVPRYPKRTQGRVWYPVGRFRTTLAGPEIAAARSRGELVSIGAGYTYKLAPILSKWATWCLDVIDGDDPSVPEVAKMAARGWGRSVVGKFAQHAYGRITLGDSPVEGWAYSEAWNTATHSRASIVDMLGTRHICYQSGDGENAFPAVLAFVESHVRVRLNDAIDMLGQDSFVQCDTDGLLLSAAGIVRRARQAQTFTQAQLRGIDPIDVILERVSEYTQPLAMRVKAAYRRVEIIGPQHLRLDGKRRFSGIPGLVDELEDGRIGAWVWPKLAHQMANGDQRGYVREYQRYRVPRDLASGWVTIDGLVLPVEYAMDADGMERVLPWDESRYAGRWELAAHQNPRVIGLISG